MRGDDFDAIYSSGYNDGFAEGYEKGRKESLCVARREEEEKERELIRGILDDGE